MNVENVKLVPLRIILLLVISLGIGFMQKTNAQARDREIPKYQYSGMEISFGIKTSHLKSTINELDDQILVAPGGNAGVVFGSSFSTFSIKPFGLYTGTGIIDRNINLYTFEVENNTYLIRGFSRKPSKFNLYSTVAINYSSYKFFGTFSNKNKNVASQDQDKRYLAKVEKLMMTGGLGIEYKMDKINNREFLHLFLSTKYQLPMQVSTRNKAFERTEFNNNFDLSFGVRFGFMKDNRNFHKRI